MAALADFFFEFDWAVLNFFHKIANPVLDVIMPLITLLGEDGILMIAVSVGLIFPKKTRKLGLTMIVSVIFSALFCNLLLKPLVLRPRAFWLDYYKNGLYYTSLYNTPEWIAEKGYGFLDIFRQPSEYLVGWKMPTDFAFPSGHSSVTFCVATAVYKLTDKKIGIPALVAAFLVGVSRLYIMVHYPTDVIGGACLGALCGLLAYFLMNWLYDKLSRKSEKHFPKYTLNSKKN